MHQPLDERLYQSTKYRGWGEKNAEVMANRLYHFEKTSTYHFICLVELPAIINVIIKLPNCKAN